MKVGDTVHDDLTGKPAKIVEIKKGAGGGALMHDLYFLDSDYLNGQRFAWELTPDSDDEAIELVGSYLK